MINRIFLTVICNCLFASLSGQTVEEFGAALDGTVFTRTLPGEEDWLGPTFIEFIKENGKMIVEAPSISSSEFTYGPSYWIGYSEGGPIELVLKGDQEMVIQIDSISDHQISGKIIKEPIENRGRELNNGHRRYDLYAVQNAIPNRDQLLVGIWNVVVDENAKKSPHFTTMEIEENGHYRLYGKSKDQNGTWRISPSGRFFIISYDGNEDTIFRVDSLTDHSLEMIQGSAYKKLLFKFER